MNLGRFIQRQCAGALFCATVFIVPSSAIAGTVTGTTSVTTLSPLGIANTAPLNFGIIIPSPGGGTVTVNARTNAATATGGLILAGGSPAAAQFVVAATAGRVISFSSSPSPNITLARAGGGATMTVNRFRISIDGAGQSTLGPNAIVPASGVLFIGFAGRLNVGANQQEGIYQSNFTLTVDYQ